MFLRAPLQVLFIPLINAFSALYDTAFKQKLIGKNLNPISAGGGVFRTPSNYAAFGDPLKVKYIEMFHADFSYLSIY